MSLILKLIRWGFVGLILLLGAVLLASERGGEVVTLTTFREDGLAQETSVWIVEIRRELWIRAGQPDSSWLERIRANSKVQLTRGGEIKDYKAVVVPNQRDRVNARMAEDYGWADQLIGLLRDGSAATPIRLDPIRF